MLGAERYLDADDTIDVQDKKSMMVYLSELYNKVQEKGSHCDLCGESTPSRRFLCRSYPKIRGECGLE